MKTQSDYIYPLRVSIGSEFIDIFAANDGNFTVVLTPPETGTLTISIGGESWWGTISNVQINRINSYPPDVIDLNGEYDINTFQTNICTGNGHKKISSHTARGNVAYGLNNQQETKSAYYNVAIGDSNQKNLEQGCYNSAIGHAVQEHLITGMYNQGMGSFAQNALVSGCWNVAIGNEAERDLVDGCNNVAIGRRAGNSMVHANGNTIIGSQVAFGRSDITGDGTVSDERATIDGSWQTLMGFQATQSSAVQADYLTAIGARAEGAENATAIGAGVSAKGIGSVAIGKDSDGNSAIANRADDFVLGTAKHTIILAGHKIIFNQDGTVTWELVT